MTRKEELAWAAGFIDGEGHFGSYDRGTIGFDLSQSEPAHDLLYRMQRLFGFGKVNGPYVYGNRKPAYRFQVSNYAHVKEIVLLVSPWLGATKLEQANAALKHFEETTWRSRPKTTHCRKGHELNVKNTYKRKNGARGCRMCQRDWQRDYRERAAQK